MNISKFHESYFIDIFDKTLELNVIIKKFYKRCGNLDDNLVFDIYVCSNLKVFIVVNKVSNAADINSCCRLVYHLNSIFLFKINLLFLDDFVAKTGVYFYYDKCFYYYIDDFCYLNYIKLLELCDEVIIGCDALDIYNNGIRLSHDFLYSYQI